MSDAPYIDFDIDDGDLEINITIDADTNIGELSNVINRLPSHIMSKLYAGCKLEAIDDGVTYSSVGEAIKAINKQIKRNLPRPSVNIPRPNVNPQDQA